MNIAYTRKGTLLCEESSSPLTCSFNPRCVWASPAHALAAEDYAAVHFLAVLYQKSM